MYIHDKQWATAGKYWYLPNINVKGLVLHSIGTPQPKADVLVRIFNSPTAAASVHGFIEPGRFVETAPIMETPGKAKKCFHVGGSNNSTCIGIEMCEPSTIKYTGGATYTNLNKEATAEYIRAVTATAVEVFADLCIYHKIPVSMISTHKQSFLEGRGSNHGDPEHLWAAIGYTLADFRKDVQAAINEKKGDVLQDMTKQEMETIVANAIAAANPVYKTVKDVPEWGRATIAKLLTLGHIQGNGNDEDGSAIINKTPDFVQTMVVLDRAGVFDKTSRRAAKQDD